MDGGKEDEKENSCNQLSVFVLLKPTAECFGDSRCWIKIYFLGRPAVMAGVHVVNPVCVEILVSHRYCIIEMPVYPQPSWPPKNPLFSLLTRTRTTSMKRCIVDFPQRRKDLSLRWFLFADSFLVSHRTPQSAYYLPYNEFFISCMTQYSWLAHLHLLSP